MSYWITIGTALISCAIKSIDGYSAYTVSEKKFISDRQFLKLVRSGINQAGDAYHGRIYVHNQQR